VHDTPEEDTERIFGAQIETDIDIPNWFDSNGYLLANPDVARSVALGSFNSAYQHYFLYGRAEQRPLHPPVKEPQNRIIRTQQTADEPTNPELSGALDAVMLSPAGGIFIVGWVDDTVSPLQWIKISGANWHVTLNDSRTARIRRTDVEAAIDPVRTHPFGFFSFAYAAAPLDIGTNCRVLLHMNNNRELAFDVPARRATEIELRDALLSYVAGSETFGNRQVERVRMLRGPLSTEIVKHNNDITREIIKGAYVERFGPADRSPTSSMVVCLYGKPEYLFLQSALFGGAAGFENYEMIYVSNSPEMAEQLIKDARTCSLIYGLQQTIVLLPGNAGFGAANNIAVSHARSDRILIVNPDVFPRDNDWAEKHTRIVRDLPRMRTKLFGASLFYDDGSLMHGGMYFEYDRAPSMSPTGFLTQRMARVEHFGKGAPEWSERFTRARPVPAVTGAFISFDRAWYEKLGGFTEDFVFGHYEDADLCLRSIAAGVAPWMHDIRLWHLEGKGSSRLPVHEGGSYVNRAVFSERWESLIDSGLEGPNPTHALMQPDSRTVDTASANQTSGHIKLSNSIDKNVLQVAGTGAEHPKGNAKRLSKRRSP
jgi:GT2 family glycosyltransferase